MKQNQSPWLEQLNRKRPVIQVKENIQSDVVIVGGGIAGVATAHYTLKHTPHRVVLVEAGKVAHAATGRNAGLLTSAIERPFHELVAEFGRQQAADGIRAIESAWKLIDEIVIEAELKTSIWPVTGYVGLRDSTSLLTHLADLHARDEAGLKDEVVVVAEGSPALLDVPRGLRKFLRTESREAVLELLQTNDPDFVAASPERMGCMNSALFTEELVGILLERYQERFSLYEDSFVRRVVLKGDHGVVQIGAFTVGGKHVVLCTNGFENFSIVNTSGRPIDGKFHHMVKGSVGYMVGYVEDAEKAPAGFAYLPSHYSGGDSFSAPPYFYLSRRPYEMSVEKAQSLVCVGGPETLVEDTTTYKPETHSAESANEEFTTFLRKGFKGGKTHAGHYAFSWHGLMGYTPSGVRLVGHEPCNQALLYNLGCNGIGLLPSIYGGYRIGQLLAGKKFPPSIFDPRDIRCETK